MKKKVAIIGSGFAGLSAASFLAKDNYDVHVFEKQSTVGGRARRLQLNGFTFDMGPSWYWMPDVFERYFSSFNKNVADYYSLVRLDPSYRIFWNSTFTDVPATPDALSDLFESWEPGASNKLKKFLKEAAFKYAVAMEELVYRPGLSLMEFADTRILNGLLHMDVFTSMKKHIAKYFRDERIRQLLEFPVLFLGALPENTPALYSLMNFADIEGGTWYPRGGMYEIVKGMQSVAEELGVQFHFEEEVTGFHFKNAQINKLITTRGEHEADSVVAAADYHFVDQHLLPEELRTYTKEYWESREMSPSCLLYYVGINKKLNNVQHHNLFFDVPFDGHAREIYTTKSWPREPLFYLNVSSKTDPSCAPHGCENLFFLIPVTAGLEGDSDELREKYFKQIMGRLEERTGENIRENILFVKTFAVSDFEKEYHSYRGNAYGLANTLRQTAILKPTCKSRKIKNLFYAGQLTVPGPGVPPSLISGEVVAGVTSKYLNKRT